MSQNTKPPFRADHVGSLLRPAALKEARAKFANGEIAAAALKEIEDREIERVIKKQEEVGLKSATDGEFRRAWWHFDFMGMLDGLDIEQREGGGIQFHGTTTKSDVPVINGPLGFPDEHPMLEHFKFLKAHAKVKPTI